MNTKLRLRGNLRLQLDSAGTVSIWIPKTQRFEPILPKQLEILRLFADGSSPNEVLQKAPLDNHEEGAKLCQWFTDLGLLVPSEPEVVFDETFPLAIRELTHVVLPVSNIDRSLIFYRDKMGLLVKARGDGVIEVATGISALVLSEISEKTTPLKLTFNIPERELILAKKKLLAIGVEVEGPVNKSGREQVLVIKDPDGHILELISRVYPSEWNCSILRRPSYVPPLRGKGPSDGVGEGVWTPKRVIHVEDLPWYTDRLDEDLIEVLHKYAPLPGRFLDVGCGHGRAAARLAAIGYEVVGIDLMPRLIEYARKCYASNNPRLKYECADICQPITNLGTFDYVFDRGCFHFSQLPDTSSYIRNIYEVVQANGKLFLKTFSKAEPEGWGPNRFSADDISVFFYGHFSVLYQIPSSFESTLSHDPKAVFSVLQKTLPKSL